jgi:F-type H+-transporting ATPase subunit c
MEAEVLQVLMAAVVVAGFGIAIAAIGCGLAMGMGLKAAVTGIARNPEASGKIMTTMLIGLALIESLAIYTLVVSLLLIFVAPQGVSFTSLLGQ